MDYFGKVLKLRFNLEFRRFQNNINSENIQKIPNIRKFRKFRSNPIQIFWNWNWNNIFSSENFWIGIGTLISDPIHPSGMPSCGSAYLLWLPNTSLHSAQRKNKKNNTLLHEQK